MFPLYIIYFKDHYKAQFIFLPLGHALFKSHAGTYHADV